MLEWNQIRKSYRDGNREKEILQGIDLKLNRGDRLFITGPSGSGKTTLLSLLGLIEVPDGGTVCWDGKILDWRRKYRLCLLRRRQIGYIYQNFNLVSYLTTLDNILLPFLPEGITPSLRKRALQLMEQLGIISLAGQFPLQCSGGEKQRIAIARALLKEPLLLLADEPTGELDRENSLRTMEIFHRFLPPGEGIVVIVTHDRDLIGETDKRVKLVEGKLEWPL